MEKVRDSQNSPLSNCMGQLIPISAKNHLDFSLLMSEVDLKKTPPPLKKKTTRKMKKNLYYSQLHPLRCPLQFCTKSGLLTLIYHSFSIENDRKLPQPLPCPSRNNGKNKCNFLFSHFFVVPLKRFMNSVKVKRTSKEARK